MWSFAIGTFDGVLASSSLMTLFTAAKADRRGSAGTLAMTVLLTVKASEGIWYILVYFYVKVTSFDGIWWFRTVKRDDDCVGLNLLSGPVD